MNNKVQEISGVKIPWTPRVMLFLDFEGCKKEVPKDLMASMLTAATLLIAKKKKENYGSSNCK